MTSLGHALSFAKRGNIISWFDPNYGEITFNNFQDFKIWFLEETKENGSLAYICAKEIKSEKSLKDYFPVPIFDQEQKKNAGILSKKIINKMEAQNKIREEKKVLMLVDYTVESYSKRNSSDIPISH